MNRKHRILYFAVPSIYLLLCIYFILLHFSQYEYFSGVLSNIVVRGRMTKASGISDPEIKKLSIQYNGLDFLIKKSRPVILVTEDEINHRLPVLNYEITQHSVNVYLKYDIVLHFIPDPHSQKVDLKPEVPALMPKAQTLLIPVSLIDGFYIESVSAEEGAISVKENGKDSSFTIKFPSNVQLDVKNEIMAVQMQGDFDHDIVISPATGKGKTASLWYEQEGKSLSAGIYRENVNLYLGSGYNSWQKRFDQKTGQFSFPDGSDRYSEQAIAAFLSESIPRDQYAKNLSFIDGAFEKPNSHLTLLSSPFLDDIVTNTDKARSGFRQDSVRIQELISEENTEVFNIPDLLPFIFDFNLESRIPELHKMILTPKKDERQQEILNRINMILECSKNGVPVAGEQTLYEELKEQIIQRIFWIDDGLYLVSRDGTVDIFNSILAGYLFINASQIYNNEKDLAVGRKLILSSLKLADDSGTIPAVLSFSGEKIKDREGSILPEDIYKYISDNPFYPRRISLRKEMGEGCWIYTTAEKITATHSPAETTFAVDFPKGESHHFVIEGVRPFQEIQMHGIKWNTDRRFQYYSDGWLYNEATGTLFIKITHRRPTEIIKILY